MTHPQVDREKETKLTYSLRPTLQSLLAPGACSTLGQMYLHVKTNLILVACLQRKEGGGGSFSNLVNKLEI